MAKKDMMKDCFSAHSMMHSLIGLGIGLFLAAVIPSLAMWWLGVVIVVIGVVWDWMRK